MQPIRTRHLTTIRFQGQFPPHELGETPYGRRRIVPIIGGSFEGERLSGSVLPVGADWALIRRDGVFDGEVRSVLRTHDGALIAFSYLGRIHSPTEGLEGFLTRTKIPADLYYNMSGRFECATDSPYAWLNDIVTVMRGIASPVGSDYEVHEVL